MNQNKVPHETQIIFAEKYNQLKEYIAEFFKKYKSSDGSQVVMSDKEAQEFKRGLDNLK